MRSSFTLVEVMIVVAIIALLVAISIPNLLRARIDANETAAITNIKTISAAQQGYRTANPAYAVNFVPLITADPPYLKSSDSVGYSCSLTAGFTATSASFLASCQPSQWSRTGVRGFCVTETGVIHVFTQAQYNTMSWNSLCYGDNTVLSP